MSGRNRGGEDEGLHEKARFLLDMPEVAIVVHMRKRGRDMHASICGNGTNASGTESCVTCAECLKMISRRRRRAA